MNLMYSDRKWKDLLSLKEINARYDLLTEINASKKLCFSATFLSNYASYYASIKGTSLLTIEEVDNGLAHDLSINSVNPENLKQINDLTNQREDLINQINSHRHKLISKINLALPDS
jgi:hypothetical protein